MVTVVLLAVLAAEPERSDASGLSAPPVPVEAEAAEPARATPPADLDDELLWSIGVGLFGWQPAFLGEPGGASLAIRAPWPTLGLERRLEGPWSLVLGAGVSYTTSSAPSLGGLAAGMTATSQLSAAVGVGARYVLTRPGAPVAILAHALVTGGYSEWPTGSMLGHLIEGSLLSGVAVERELLERVSIRVGANLVRIRYARGEIAQLPPAEGSTPFATFQAGLSFDPSLELRLYF